MKKIYYLFDCIPQNCLSNIIDRRMEGSFALIYIRIRVSIFSHSNQIFV